MGLRLEEEINESVQYPDFPALIDRKKDVSPKLLPIRSLSPGAVAMTSPLASYTVRRSKNGTVVRIEESIPVTSFPRSWKKAASWATVLVMIDAISRKPLTSL